MLEADVTLRGQGTDKQELVPVMAQLTNKDSELTFQEWLNHVIKASSKGFKLHFQTIDALEVTLQKMTDKKDEVCVFIFSLTLHAFWSTVLVKASFVSLTYSVKPEIYILILFKFSFVCW